MASAFISYLGPFNKEFRDLLLMRNFLGGAKKLAIPVTPALDVAAFLADASEIGQLTLQGLPTDTLSVQNGILVTRATRYPLLIDSQGQGRTWLRNKEAAAQLRTTNLTDKHFRAALEECMAQGRPLLIENVDEELDPLLDPVLERRIVKRGRTFSIALADKEVCCTDSLSLTCYSTLSGHL